MALAVNFASVKRNICCQLVCLTFVIAGLVSPVYSNGFNNLFDTLVNNSTPKTSLFSLQFASFQDSCRNIRVNGNTLSASCRNERGRYVATTIQILGITNVNGNLEYLRDGRGRSTYQDTCTSITVSGANLSAECRREDGSLNYSTVFLRNIYNDNGRLRYNFDGNDDGGGNPVDPPDNGATFQDSCRNIRVSTTTLSAQCRDENRRWRNSSVQIRGITNVNGNLEYLRDGRGRSSYQETCTNIRIDGATLTARCQREDGSSNRTSIVLRGIINDDGRLRYRLD